MACRYREQSILGAPGGALTLAAQEAPKAWIRSGARYVGMVARLLEMSLEHARDWISLGDALAVRPAVQRMLAEMHVEVEVARWLTYHAAWQADTGAGDDLRSAAAQVRLATGEMLKRAVDRATMIFAGPGPSSQIEPQRFVRSVAPPEVLDLALEQARAVILADTAGTARCLSGSSECWKRRWYMNVNRVLEVQEGNATHTAQRFLSALWQKHQLDALLAPVSVCWAGGRNRAGAPPSG